MNLAVSWRNIWRNKLRSSVIIIAIALGVFAGVFTWAFYEGMVEQRVNNLIKTEVSHVQIHAKGYVEDPELQKFIPDTSGSKLQLDTISGVKAFTNRVITNAMLVSAKTGAGAQLIGIDPEQEKQVTNLYNKIVDGEYLTGIKRNPIIIGESLAEKLNLKLRSRVVVNLQQMDGDITRAQFRVAGIFRTTNSMYDNMNAFVKSTDLLKVIGSNQSIYHETAIILDNYAAIEPMKEKLQNYYPNLEVKHWRDLMPEVSLIEETMDVQMMFIMVIILLALAFGIINTMLMAVLERVKELGMLMAIGMNKFRVFMMIMLETVMLSLTGGVLGIFIGTLVSLLLKDTGIDLSAWSKAYERMGFDTLIYPVLEWRMLYIVTIMVVVTGLFASVFPAIRALKLKPAEAIRSDM